MPSTPWSRAATRTPASSSPSVSRRTGRPGYDFNFHATKSVSLAYELTGDERILQAFQASVRETMLDIETDMVTRDQRRGKNVKVKTGNLIGAEFTHFTSRPSAEDGLPDPQLHMHVFVMNATRKDGKRDQWFAPEFHDIKVDMPYHQAAFQKRFAAQLQQLGYGIEQTKDAFEIKGLGDRALIDKFSRRATEIEELARRKGITDPKEKDKLAAKTRTGKVKDLSREELRAYWKSRLTEDDRDALRRVAEQAKNGPEDTPPGGPSAAEGLDFALDHHLERASTVDRRRLAATALRHTIASPGVSVEDIHGAIDTNPEILQGTYRGRRMVTTKAVYQEERWLIDYAAHGVNTCRPFKEGPLTFQPQDRRQGRHLHAQRGAAACRDDTSLEARDRVQLFIGDAGTGKSSTLKEIARHLKESGRNVLGLAPSSTATGRPAERRLRGCPDPANAPRQHQAPGPGHP